MPPALKLRLLRNENQLLVSLQQECQSCLSGPQVPLCGLKNEGLRDRLGEPLTTSQNPYQKFPVSKANPS